MGGETNKLNQLVALFERLFGDSQNTRLVPGASEPFYQAASELSPAQILSRADYFSSALHELAHWCVAGKQRRSIDDYGYWYAPDGRNDEQQKAFEQVEVKPQAIEWAFALACAHEFHFSADNLASNAGCSEAFKCSVEQQLRDYLTVGFPDRAQQLFDAMAKEFLSESELVKWQQMADRQGLAELLEQSMVKHEVEHV